jgi:hypothetical protein
VQNMLHAQHAQRATRTSHAAWAAHMRSRRTGGGEGGGTTDVASSVPSALRTLPFTPGTLPPASEAEGAAGADQVGQ